jgi:hypothetical protein
MRSVIATKVYGCIGGGSTEYNGLPIRPDRTAGG